MEATSSSQDTRFDSVPSGVAPTGSAFTPGTMLADRYRVVAMLGKGAMGEVYRADDLRLGQPVALKFLAEVLQRDPVARARLIEEARHARNVAHPNVCRVYDIGELDRPASGAGGAGRLYLSMEYIDGEDLGSLLRRIGKLPPSKALETARQLCAGLAAAHERGVLHRDLKPANVMIDGQGHARITDFGLAVDGSTGGSPADFAGTVAYMSPERLRGDPATIQSDLFALGLTIYQACTGEPAFKASTLDEWRAVHTASTPRRPSAISRDLDPALEQVILRCIESRPEDRPLSARHAAAALPGGDPLAAAVAAGETPSPEMVAAASDGGALSRRKAWGLLGASLAAVAAVVALASWVHLPSLVAFKGSPEVLRVNARDVLTGLGYADVPADHSWWFTLEQDYRAYLIGQQPSSRRFGDLAGMRPGPLVFHYRQSASRLVPLDSTGVVTDADPAPGAPGDAIVETDSMGRLTGLRVWPPPQSTAGAAAPPTDWEPLLHAVGVDAGSLREARPERVPPMFSDARMAWSGELSGVPVRIEAAACLGRPVFLALQGPWTAAAAVGQPSVGSTTLVIKQTVTALLWTVSFVVLAVLSVRNLRLGRGDQRGAVRVAVFILGTLAIASVLRRHWSVNPAILWDVVSNQFGLPLFMAVAGWLYYLGCEPFVRRRWPRYLIGWVRLMDGRWRDPLVGRGLLAGVIGGAVMALLLAAPEALGRQFGLPGTFPDYAADSLNGANRFAALFFRALADAVTRSLGLTAFVLIAQRVTGSDRGAMVAGAAVVTLVSMPGTENVWLELAAAIPIGVLVIWLLRHFGLLAITVLLVTFDLLVWSPLTIDPSRWFLWRSAAPVGACVFVAAWGFRNVLGRQSVFPVGELD